MPTFDGATGRSQVRLSMLEFAIARLRMHAPTVHDIGESCEDKLEIGAASVDCPCPESLSHFRQIV